MFQAGNVEPRYLGCVVPMPQPHGVAVGGVALELGSFQIGHDTALKREAQARGGREAVEIGRDDRAEISLGGDVQADRLGDFGAEVLREPGTAGFLMAAVDAAIGEILVLAVEQMPHVVQERSHDKPVGRSSRSASSAAWSACSVCETASP